MKTVLILGVFCFLSFTCLGQNEYLKIGKRKNIIWGKKLVEKI